MGNFCGGLAFAVYGLLHILKPCENNILWSGMFCGLIAAVNFKYVHEIAIRETLTLEKSGGRVTYVGYDEMQWHDDNVLDYF